MKEEPYVPVKAHAVLTLDETLAAEAETDSNTLLLEIRRKLDHICKEIDAVTAGSDYENQR